MATFRFLVRETSSVIVDVQEESYDAAQAEIQRQCESSEINLDKHLDGVEFRPCCSKCQSDFEDDYDMREINIGTNKAMMLCDRCVESMEENGEITRCECCGELFSPSRLGINPENGEQEICPECGEVWCD